MEAAMRWKQFFTPVKSMDAVAAEQYLQETPLAERTLLDVRQPGEYAAGHIPGARLIPLPELGDRLDEIDEGKTVLVYCAVGGRSRVAAQMMAGKGYASVINLAGGFKAWQGKQALFDETRGLDLFTGRETVARTLEVAFALEGGLQEFYQKRAGAAQDSAVAALFGQLAAIEARHQERIFSQYRVLSPGMESREVFEAHLQKGVLEGGLPPKSLKSGILQGVAIRWMPWTWPWPSRPRPWISIPGPQSERQTTPPAVFWSKWPARSRPTCGAWGICSTGWLQAEGDAEMKKKLLLVGGGHAHMMTLAHIHRFVDAGIDVSVLGPSAHHYYSGMGPGMLGRFYTPEDIRFRTRHLVEKQGGRFILGRAVDVLPEEKVVVTDSGEHVPYDTVSFNAGSQVPRLATDGSVEAVYTAKPIEKLIEARDRLTTMMAEGPVAVAILGGGPSSIEIAGNVWRLAQVSGGHPPAISVYAGSGLMARFPAGIRRRAAASLSRRGIRILEKERVRGIENGAVVMQRGAAHPADVIFSALGVRPTPIFARAGLPVGPDGGLRVNRFLQSTGYPEIFGGGDCIFFEPRPLDKVGVYAVRQNPVLLENLMASLGGTPLKPFDPGGDYLLIFNLGDGTGILRKKVAAVRRPAGVHGQGPHRLVVSCATSRRSNRTSVGGVVSDLAIDATVDPFSGRTGSPFRPDIVSMLETVDKEIVTFHELAGNRCYRRCRIFRVLHAADQDHPEGQKL
jgi:NADH dehydrogenase FAD-containing subunit/rhodanese-related sulfurtransferase